MAQKIKKKTVKDLTEDFIVMKNKFNQFEKLFALLSQKVEKYEKQDKENSLEDENIEKRPKEYLCKRCDSVFSDNKKLKVHTKEEHGKEIKCNICDEKFDQTFKLENHLKEHEVETFKCDECGKTFYLKWRLAKHKTIHETINVRFCHYFNNDKLCPFEEIGCMFLHAKSELCRFKKSCKNDLCQFRHEVIDKSMSDRNAEQANNEENLRTNKSTLAANNSDNSSNDFEAEKISNGLITDKECFDVNVDYTGFN